MYTALTLRSTSSPAQSAPIRFSSSNLYCDSNSILRTLRTRETVIFERDEQYSAVLLVRLVRWWQSTMRDCVVFHLQRRGRRVAAFAGQKSMVCMRSGRSTAPKPLRSPVHLFQRPYVRTYGTEYCSGTRNEHSDDKWANVTAKQTYCARTLNNFVLY